MYGTSGADQMYGLGGSDLMYGLAGNDLMYGGYGDDYINVKDGKRDRVWCGPGRDSFMVDSIDEVVGARSLLLKCRQASLAVRWTGALRASVFEYMKGSSTGPYDKKNRVIGGARTDLLEAKRAKLVALMAIVFLARCGSPE